MIQQVKGIDGRDRVVIELKTLETWCRKYFEKSRIKLPEDFIIEIKVANNMVTRFENDVQDLKLKGN